MTSYKSCGWSNRQVCVHFLGRRVNEPNEHEQGHVCVRSFNFKRIRVFIWTNICVYVRSFVRLNKHTTNFIQIIFVSQTVPWTFSSFTLLRVAYGTDSRTKDIHLLHLYSTYSTFMTSNNLSIIIDQTNNNQTWWSTILISIHDVIILSLNNAWLTEIFWTYLKR